MQVRVLIDVARGYPECAVPPNSNAVAKLSAFVDGFEALQPEDVPSPEVWDAFVEKYVAPGWEVRRMGCLYSF